MPANRGLGSPNWSPKADFKTGPVLHHDWRAVEFTDPDAVAACLLEDDPSYQAYELFSEFNMAEEALKDAQAIIDARTQVLVRRLSELDANSRYITAARLDDNLRLIPPVPPKVPTIFVVTATPVAG